MTKNPLVAMEELCTALGLDLMQTVSIRMVFQPDSLPTVTVTQIIQDGVDVGQILHKYFVLTPSDKFPGNVIKDYEEMRALIDGGSESMTHDDAMYELRQMIEDRNDRPSDSDNG